MKRVEKLIGIAPDRTRERAYDHQSCVNRISRQASDPAEHSAWQFLHPREVMRQLPACECYQVIQHETLPGIIGVRLASP
jgi:hypothetical protein